MIYKGREASPYALAYASFPRWMALLPLQGADTGANRAQELICVIQRVGGMAGTEFGASDFQ